MTVLQFACACALVPLCASAQPMPTTASGRTPQAPPTAPPIVVAEPPAGGFRPAPRRLGNTPYSIGEPTDEEQLYLEYINRARANPPAEGAILANTTDPDVLAAYSYFGVDLGLMQSQFNAIAVAPPLAMNAQLMAAARLHSLDMFTYQYQGHTNMDGSVLTDRVTLQGYVYFVLAENVFSYAESVFHGHAGFEVDWGTGGIGGMQNPPGHRENIHNSIFREVGVGVVNGVNGTVGPQLVTQDFGTQPSAPPLITGVVYYDVNSNGSYDLGEGLGGVMVQVPGSTYFATTANSGGYAVPVTTNGSYAMSFSASGLPTNQTVATVTSLRNVKVDYILAYSPPVVSGPNPAALNENNNYSFTTVGGATNYQCEITRLAPYTAVEGAENGTNYVTIVSSPGYSVFASDVKASGTYSFHFCMPVAADQSLTFNTTIRPRANSQLTFAKRLGWADSGQVARAQVSTNGGVSWQDLWSQVGSGSSGDTSFTRITNSLSDYANLNLKLRFVYDFIGGYYFYQTSPGVGLYLDDIAVSNADEPQTLATNSVGTATSFAFFPTNTSDYSFRVRAVLPGRTFDWGPSLRVSVSSLPPMTIQFAGTPARLGNQFQADFNVVNYRTGTSFLLLQTPDLGESWTPDAAAAFSTIVSNTQFRVTTINTASRAFYRIQVN